MALVLTATAKSATANSYCTVAEGNTYHLEHLYDTDWQGAADITKTAALVWATRLLDEQIIWDGAQTTETQALRWPRGAILDQDGNEFDEDTIPQFLKNATAEYARYLIGANRTAEADTKGIRSVKAGELEVIFDKYDRTGVIPPSVFSMIKAYGTKAKKLARVLNRL